MTRIALPALVIVVVVAGYVAAAGWNASGEPLAVITLTERELPLVWTNRQGDEDRGLQLQIAYDGRYDPLDSRNWLSEQRLREIGFALHVPVGSPQAVHTYDHVPSRVAWVVLEYDGPQWRDIERRRALREAARHVERSNLFHSRLVPVDAGVDVDALRQRYPTGHVIVRAVIGLSYVSADAAGRVLYGTLRQIVPPHVAVPRRFRSVLEALPPQASAKVPRYEVDLAIGRLGVPYVRAVRAF
jgi:hypothetical protein